MTETREPDPVDLAMRDMEVAIEEASICRLRASEYRQLGFHAYADELMSNAKGAEKWLIKAGRVYPARCGAERVRERLAAGMIGP